MRQQATFDVNEKLREKRKFRLRIDSQVHGGGNAENRVFGICSDEMRLDALHKELNLSPQKPGGIFNHPMGRQCDTLLHGGSESNHRLFGFYSSAEKLDELDKLKLQTARMGYQKSKGWTKNGGNEVHPPFTRKNLLERDEDNHEFGECGLCIQLKNPCSCAKPSPKKELTERLYDLVGQRLDQNSIVSETTGSIDLHLHLKAYPSREARGMSDMGIEFQPPPPTKAYHVVLREENEAMREDPEYQWASKNGLPARRKRFSNDRRFQQEEHALRHVALYPFQP